MKVKLLNAGGFIGLKNVKFPVIVDAKLIEGLTTIYSVDAEIIRAIPGSNFRANSAGQKVTSFLFLDAEVEAVK